MRENSKTLDPNKDTVLIIWGWTKVTLAFLKNENQCSKMYIIVSKCKTNVKFSLKIYICIHNLKKHYYLM